MDVQISKSQIQEDLKKIETRRNEIDTELQKLQLEKEQLQERERVLRRLGNVFLQWNKKKQHRFFIFFKRLEQSWNRRNVHNNPQKL